MPTRDSYTADPTAGDVLTAANFRKLPGGWIGYDASTTNQTTSGTTELTLHTLSVPVDASRRLRITYHTSRCTLSVDGDDFTIRSYYDGAQVNAHTARQSRADGVEFLTVADTTAAGSKTIAITAQRITGTGTLQLRGASTDPAFMLVEDMGPSS